MSNENELLEPLATEAGQQAIVRAIRDISSLEYAVRAEQAASTASAKAGEASQSALEASEAEDKAKDWATKTDGYVEQQIITIPPAQEGEEPTTETINLYSARYYAALAQDIYNNMSFDSVPTENSTNMVSSGTVYSALDLKADKSTTYTKTEVDTALSNVQGQLTFDNVPTANSDNPVKSSGIKTALDSKQDTLTFDSTPTANSTNPVTSGGVYTALQNVNIDIDDEITEDSDNPVTSAAIYEALQNFTPSGGDSGGAGNASGVVVDSLYKDDNGINGVNSQITLNKSFKDYDFLVILTGHPSESPLSSEPRLKTFFYLVSKIKENQDFSYGFDAAGRYGNLKFTTDTTAIFTQSNTEKVYEIKGIKFSKNLSEQMYSNVLYENSSGVNSGTIILNDNFDNYDFISVEVWDGQNGNAKNQCYYSKEFLQQCKEDDKFIISIRYHESTLYYKITNLNTVTFGGSNGGCKLYKITGYKLAKGGYSGIVSDARMTVKSGVVELSDVLATYGNSDESVIFDSPMPDTNYVVSVSREFGGTGWVAVEYKISNKTVNGFTLTINNQYNYATSEKPKFSWIAIRPNSYTREGMVEDVLFSNASGATGIINLSHNISDYDLLLFYNSPLGNNGYYRNSTMYTPTYLQSLTDATGNGNSFLLNEFDNRYVKCAYVNDTTINAFESFGGSKIEKIIGIKFGRYVSGVSVDTTVTQNSNAVVTSGAVYDALQNIPSGGGSGSSITIDSVPTENSQNAVSSGGVYDALQTLDNKQVDIFRLSTHSIDGDITADATYLRNTANEQIYYGDAGGDSHQVYKSNDIPCIFCMVHTRYDGYNWAYIVAISGKEQGLEIYKKVNNSTSFNSSKAITVISSGQISNQSIASGYNWYYKIYDIKVHPWESHGLYHMNSGTTYSRQAGSVPASDFLLLANPTLLESSIKEELFYPTNYTITSGSTLSDNTLKSLITGYRPIQINGETYYFVKLDNGTYYYENPNNTITINSSLVVTITAKSSGGSSIIVDSTITQGGTNPVEGGAIYTALDDKADKSTTYTKTEVDTALTSKGDVTTNTDQNITGTKTFVGSKKVGFKQYAANDKLGFTLFGNTGTERGYLEFNPTNTVDGVTGLMTIGNYATSAAGLTQVGFRRYSNISGASGAYNLLMPMVADARTPFSLTTTYQNFYLPLGFKNGSTIVKTDKSGVVDISSLLASLEARVAALEGN